MGPLLQQINQIFRPIELQKNCLLSQECLATFDKIIISISFNNLHSEDDPALVEAITLMESLSMQKVVVKKGEYTYVGSKKVYVTSLVVTLRGKRMYSFLDYCLAIFFPLFMRRQGVLEVTNTVISKFTLAIEDYNSFFNLRHKMSKGKLHIAFITKEVCNKSFYKALGFPLR